MAVSAVVPEDREDSSEHVLANSASVSINDLETAFSSAKGKSASSTITLGKWSRTNWAAAFPSCPSNTCYWKPSVSELSSYRRVHQGQIHVHIPEKFMWRIEWNNIWSIKLGVRTYTIEGYSILIEQIITELLSEVTDAYMSVLHIWPTPNIRPLPRSKSRDKAWNQVLLSVWSHFIFRNALQLAARTRHGKRLSPKLTILILIFETKSNHF